MPTPTSEEFKKKATSAVLRVREAAKTAKIKQWAGMINRVKQVEERKILEIKKKLKEIKGN